MIPTAWMPARHRSPMLSQPLPKRCSAACSQSVGTHANDTLSCAGCRADLTWFKEKVHTSLWPIHSACAVCKQPNSTYLCLKLIEEGIEALDVMQSLTHCPIC
jgi:hypothetical protein